MSPNEFNMEFAAEFAGTAGEKFIPDVYVNDAVKMGLELNLDQAIQGKAGYVYYAHLDPAITSHNYAMVILHVEERMRVLEDFHGIPKKERFKLFVVDHIKTWRPSLSESVNVLEVDSYIAQIGKYFRLAQLTLDAWDAPATMQRLKAKGIPTKITPFRKAYKMKIYDNLEHLLVNHQIALPNKNEDHDLLIKELKFLKRQYTANGYKIKPDPEAQVQTDDIVDALAGAIGSALDAAYGGYPKAATVYMPQTNPSDSRVWNIGTGQFNDANWNMMKRKFGKLDW
jgi:hypothetical protein